MRKINFSKNFPNIVCGSIATQHAHCHKEYYSPRGQAVSTSHFLREKVLAAVGEPSTWFPPEGLVETVGTTHHALYLL